MKADGQLARNLLKGRRGDAMNALLCGAGYSLRKILRRLALLYAQILQPLMQKNSTNGHPTMMTVC